MFSYILFDLDGTISDPREGITKSVQYALESFGIYETDLKKLEPFIGPPLRDSFMEFYGFTPEQAETAVAKYRERFSVTGKYENVLYPGMRELLQELKSSGLHLGIASSKPAVFVEDILNYFGIRPYFEVVVGSELDGTREKKEEVLMEALRRFGAADRDSVVLVGDRKYDMEGAKQVGIHQIGVTYGFAAPGELLETDPQIVVRDVSGLRQVLLGYRAPQPQNVYDARYRGPLPKDTDYVSRYRSTASSVKERRILGAAGNCAGAMALYYVVGLAAVAAVLFLRVIWGNFWPEMAENETFWLHLGNAAGMILGCVCCLGVWHKQIQIKPVKKLDRLSLLPMLILSASLALGMNGVLSIVELYRFSPAFQEISEFQVHTPIWLGILEFGVLAPLGEEVVFRGVVYGQLKRASNVPVALVLSALLFGLYHGNLVQFVYAGTLGLAMALVYEVYGSLLLSVLFHAVANLTVYFLLDLLPIGSVFLLPFCCVAFLAMSLVSLILMVVWQRQKQK